MVAWSIGSMARCGNDMPYGIRPLSAMRSSGELGWHAPAGCTPSSRPVMMAATREDAMDLVAMLREFCAAVEQRDGTRFATLFREDGVYHDVFYGPFTGRTDIAAMIDDWFHRTAAEFRWDMHEPVCDGRTLYARYTFSYRSLLPEAQGARVVFEGVAIMTLVDGLIATYPEVADVGS